MGRSCRCPPSRRTLLGGAAAVAASGLIADAVTAAPATAATVAATPAALLPADPIAHLLRRATYGPTPGHAGRGDQLGVSGLAGPPAQPGRDRRRRLRRAGGPAAAGRRLDRGGARGAAGPLVRRVRPARPRRRSRGPPGASGSCSRRSPVSGPTTCTSRRRPAASGTAAPDYDQHVIRRHAFGRFADMLKASARHPAMLTYLDNRSSTRAHPNENYARELMELHTVGLIYTEADVQAAARLLTGLTVDKDRHLHVRRRRGTPPAPVDRARLQPRQRHRGRWRGGRARAARPPGPAPGHRAADRHQAVRPVRRRRAAGRAGRPARPGLPGHGHRDRAGAAGAVHLAGVRRERRAEGAARRSRTWPRPYGRSGSARRPPA